MNWRGTVTLTKALSTMQLMSGIDIFKHVCGIQWTLWATVVTVSISIEP